MIRPPGPKHQPFYVWYCHCKDTAPTHGGTYKGDGARWNAIRAARRHWHKEHDARDTEAKRRDHGPRVWRVYNDSAMTDEEVPWWDYPEHPNRPANAVRP